MAIPFLNNINLSDNQLLNAKLQVTGSAPSAAAGQIYFDSTDSVAKYHNGTAWVNIPRQISVSGTSLADSQAIDLVAGANVGIAESSGTITISSSDQFTGTVTSVGASTAGDALDVAVTNATTTPDLAFTWAGAASQYIDGAGNLTTFPTIPTVPSNIVETIITTNGAFIDLTPATATDGNVTITADLSAGGTPSATTYLRGDNSWEPISAIPGTYTWSIQGDAGGPTAVVSSDVIDFAGGTNVTTALSGTTLTINSTDQFVGTLTGIGAGTYISVNNSTPAVPIINALGTEAATASRLVARDEFGFGYVVTPASGDSTTKIATTAFVQAALTGLLEFKGGFRADTGQITSGANYTPGAGNETYLWGAARVLVEIGDYYIASGATSGNFYGDATYPLTPGDSVIGVADASANASVVGDWAVVQSDTDLATNSTVGLMTINPVGVGGITSNIVNGIATITNTDTNTSNTFSGLIGNGTLTSLQIPSTTHLLGNDSTSFIIQLVEVSSGETVYADVIRGASGLVTIDFANAPAANAIRVLIQKIG